MAANRLMSIYIKQMGFTKMQVDSTPLPQKSSEKIVNLFEKLLSPNAHVNNEFLNKFLTSLIEKTGNGTPLLLHSIELKEKCCQWICKASSQWYTRKELPQTSIFVFGLNLVSHLSEDEEVFFKLNGENVFEKLVDLSQINCNLSEAIVTGHINLLSCFLDHKSGVQWILATGYWIDVVTISLKPATSVTKKQAYQFVNKLFEKTVHVNQNFCSNLITILIKPLNDTLRALPNANNTEHVLLKDETLFQFLEPPLSLLLRVIEINLKKGNKAVLDLFLQMGVYDAVQELFEVTTSDALCCELIKIKVAFLFISMFESCTKSELKSMTQDATILKDIKEFFVLLENEMKKDHIMCALKVSHYSHSLWTQTSFRLPLCVRKGEKIEFETQMFVIQFIPLTTYNIQNMGETWEIQAFEKDYARLEFYIAFCRLLAIKTIEIYYMWYRLLLNNKNLLDYATFGCENMFISKSFISKELAALSFQWFVYSMEDTLAFLQSNKKDYISPREEICVKLHIKAIIEFVNEFNLTWNDSVETVSVLSLACDYLEYMCVSEKLVVEELKLMGLGISRYMSPNMALLIDETKDSVISTAARILYKKCQDSSREIRNTALEAVYYLSNHAATKFPSFKNVLLENDLPQSVSKIAFNDVDFQVRATAVKCLAEMVKISEIWNLLSSTENFLETVLAMFDNDVDEVLIEAVTLLHQIHQTQELDDIVSTRMNDIMLKLILENENWKVKVNALSFWTVSVNKLFAEQGFIDNSFPEVTWSKEKKKIVRLNQEEIKKRMILVFDQLNETGCFAAIKAAAEDKDERVSQKALDYVVKIVDMNKKYKVTGDDIIKNSEYQKNMLRTNSTLPGSTSPEFIPDDIMSIIDSFEDSTQISNDSSLIDISVFDNLDLSSPSNELDLFTPPKSTFSEDSARYSMSEGDEYLNCMDRNNPLSSEVLKTKEKGKINKCVVPSEFVEFLREVMKRRNEEQLPKSNIEKLDLVLDSFLLEYTDTEIKNSKT